MERRRFLAGLTAVPASLLLKGLVTQSVQAQSSSQAPGSSSGTASKTGPEILKEYVSTYRDPARVHGICEEYRAAATIDVEHDQADCPMLHPWAEGGPLDTFYEKDGGPLGIWRQWEPQVHGQAMKGSHIFPEENPEDTVVLVKRFLSA